MTPHLFILFLTIGFTVLMTVWYFIIQNALQHRKFLENKIILHNQKGQLMQVDKEIIKAIAKIKVERIFSMNDEHQRQIYRWGTTPYLPEDNRNKSIKQFIHYYINNIINDPAAELKSHPDYLKSKNIYAPLVRDLYDKYGLINYKEVWPEIDFDTPTKKATTTRNKRK